MPTYKMVIRFEAEDIDQAIEYVTNASLKEFAEELEEE